jgi:hypothetical protein
MDNSSTPCSVCVLIGLNYYIMIISSPRYLITGYFVVSGFTNYNQKAGLSTVGASSGSVVTVTATATIGQIKYEIDPSVGSTIVTVNLYMCSV